MFQRVSRRRLLAAAALVFPLACLSQPAHAAPRVPRGTVQYFRTPSDVTSNRVLLGVVGNQVILNIDTVQQSNGEEVFVLYNGTGQIRGRRPATIPVARVPGETEGAASGTVTVRRARRGFTITANIEGVATTPIAAQPLKLLKIAYPLLGHTFSGPFAGGTTITVTFDRRAGTFVAVVTGGGATQTEIRGRFTPVVVRTIGGEPAPTIIVLADTITVNNPQFGGIFREGVPERVPFELTGDDLETLVLRVNGQSITLTRQ